MRFTALCALLLITTLLPLTAHAEGGESEIPAAALPTRAFAKDTWTAYSYFAAPIGENDGNVFAGRLGGGYHLDDNFSFNVELVGAFIDVEDNGGRPGGKTGAGGIDLLFRWHFLTDDAGQWSLYADGGCGFIYSGESFPANGTNLNWTPQLGLGGTYRLTTHTHLMGGVRWWHASNARKHGKDQNPTFDSVMPYLGVMVDF